MAQLIVSKEQKLAEQSFAYKNALTVSRVGFCALCFLIAHDLLADRFEQLYALGVAVVGCAVARFGVYSRWHVAARLLLVALINVAIVMAVDAQMGTSRAYGYFVPAGMLAILIFSRFEIGLRVVSVCFTFIAGCLTVFLPGVTAIGQYLPTPVDLLIDTVAPTLIVLVILVRTHDRLTVAALDLKAKELALVQSAKLSGLGEIAANIGHEFRSPLAVIFGNVENAKVTLAERSLDEKEVRKLVDVIGRMSVKLKDIVESLGRYARHESRLPLEDVSLHAVCHDVFTILENRIRGAQIDFTVEVAALKAKGRSTELSQVLLNLVRNSIDAVESHSERWIKIAAQAKKNCVEIRVVDSGPKIPEDIAAVMMEPFVSSKLKDQGTGLGLSVSKLVATNLGGDLFYLQGQPHTTFVLQLQLADE